MIVFIDDVIHNCELNLNSMWICEIEYITMRGISY